MTDNAAFESAPAMRGLFAGWTRAVTRHAILVLVLVSVLSGLAAWFTTATLAIDTSTTDMISAETPFRRNAIDYDRAFPQFNDLIVAVIDAMNTVSEMSTIRKAIRFSSETVCCFPVPTTFPHLQISLPLRNLFLQRWPTSPTSSACSGF